MEDISKILSGAPKGLRLYSLSHGMVTLREVTGEGTIMCEPFESFAVAYDRYGRLAPYGTCLVYPSESVRDWEYFKDTCLLTSVHPDDNMTYGCVYVVDRSKGKVYVDDRNIGRIEMHKEYVYYIKTSDGYFNLNELKVEDSISVETSEILRFADGKESKDCFKYMKSQGFLYDCNTDTVVHAN